MWPKKISCMLTFATALVCAILWLGLEIHEISSLKVEAEAPRVKEFRNNDVSLATVDDTDSQRGLPSCNWSLRNSTTYYTFYPKRFMEEGPGSQFLRLYQENDLSKRGVLSARFLVFSKRKKNRKNKGDRCELVYFHIHKNGGTTVDRHVPLRSYKYFSNQELEWGHEPFEQACHSVMTRVYQKQQQKDESVETFTFLRDPVLRFLSSLSQVLTLHGSLLKRGFYPCNERNTSEDLVDCILGKFESNGHSFLDTHFAPQSFELYKHVMGFDIAISVIDLSEIGNVLGGLGAQNIIKKERSVAGGVIKNVPQFRLTEDLLTSDVIRRICKIYEMDVLMLEQVGVTKTNCLQGRKQ
jgi:hypothetical protein